MITKYSFLKKTIILSLFLAIVIPAFTYASVGVGVGTGKIQIQKALVPGGIYELPAVPVLNTGTQISDYGVDIEYLQGQQQIKPPQNWFLLTPEIFTISPQKVKSVKITLTIPVKARPGNYFAYVEAYPVKSSSSEFTKINIAAATKLYFTIAPANIFEGVYYRGLTFVTRYAPWTYTVFGIIVLLIAIYLFRRFFNFNLGISISKKE